MIATNLCDLQYYINGRLIETIEYNKPWPILAALKKKLQHTTHRSGVLKIIPNQSL